MLTAFKQVKEELSRLEELHSSHIDAFDTQTLPDLEEQIAQRQAGFSKLEKSLAAFLLEADTMGMAKNEPMIQDVKSYLLSLVNQNKRLRLKVETHKSGLENSMKNITNGRQAIHAYGSSPSQLNQPKVINFKN